MRAKHTAEIRAGVEMAKSQIDFYEEFGHVLLMPFWNLTELGQKAFHRVSDCYAARKIVESMDRVIKTIDDNEEFFYGKSHPGHTD